MAPTTDEFEGQLARVLDLFAERQKTARALPVRAPNLRTLLDGFREKELAQAGIGVEGAVRECLERIAPGLANTATRDLSLVIGGSTPAAQLGDLLTTLWDPCVILHDHDTIAPVVEDETARLLLDLFGLPRDGFEATFTTGGSASNLVGLACARQWWGRHHGKDVAEEGLASLPSPVVYSGAAHSSIKKALSQLGIGRAALRRVETLARRTAVSPAALDAALRGGAPGPAVVVANAGEVNTGDFDDLQAVAAVCREHGAWLHVDAAFGLFARCSPDFAALARGVEAADSIATDLHKLLNVPYDSGLVILAARHRALLEQVFSATASYLGGGTTGARIHPMNRRVENSSRFRALPAWMTLKAYGRDGYRALVERTCAHARRLATLLAGSEDLALAGQPPFNIVLFQGRDRDGAVLRRPEDNQRLLRLINDTGRVSLTAGAREGQPALRAAFAKWHTDDADVEAVAAAILEGARAFRHAPPGARVTS